jgi:hypothetical protein
VGETSHHPSYAEHAALSQIASDPRQTCAPTRDIGAGREQRCRRKVSFGDESGDLKGHETGAEVQVRSPPGTLSGVVPNGSRIALGVAAVVAIAGVAVLVPHARPDAGVERAKAAIAWPSGCVDVATHDATGKRPWPRAVKFASITCEHLGPMVLYARFADVSVLRKELLRGPPSAPVCIVAREVLVDYLDPPQFARLCRRLGGDRIDAVSALPELAWDGTLGGLNRQVDAEERRDAAAQRRALRRYWHIG